MGQLDLLVLPSRYDSFGRVLLEAMQQQTPVIGSDLYGIREIIDHNENGILVPYDDDTALFSAMERILTDREFVSRLKKNAMKTVKNKFNIESYKQNIENLITSVLEERKAN